jgi:hypothetical protein
MNLAHVCYLYTRFDNIQKINNFIKNYKKFKSGLKHQLIICFKLLNDNEIEFIKKSIKDIKFVSFIDPCEDNDWDFGSYKRVAKKYYNKDILFLNSHSYPICHNWLKKLFLYKKKNTIIATTASYESILDSIKLKGKFWKIVRFVSRKWKFSKNFNSFPNPHFRTSSFLINSKYFYNYIKNKKMISKDDTLIIESGKNSLTNYFKKKKFDIFVVNSDGKKFNEKDWSISETYQYKNQQKNIISDKYTRCYLNLNNKKRQLSSFMVWGN